MRKCKSLCSLKAIAVGETYHGRLGSISATVGHVRDEQARIILALDTGGS